MALAQEARDRLAADAAVIIARYPQPRSALLPLLHLVQSEEGYVSPDGVAFCADALGLTTAEVSAVVTFYTQYKRHPNGEYTVGVCTNTLCAVMGGDAILDSLEEHLGIGHDETTEDGKVTLERLECNAACDYAPVLMVNWEFFDNQTPTSAREIVDRLREGRAVEPTRGANTVATFREVSRVLAGFSDGRAGEGIGAGTPTQRGTVLAEQMGWTAPESPNRRHRNGSNGRNGRNGSGGAATAGAAADSADRAASSSGTDPAATGERSGTVAGKPPAEATAGEGDPGTGAAAKPNGKPNGGTAKPADGEKES